MQGQSGHYPYIDNHTLREHFIKKAHLPMAPLDQASYSSIISKAIFNSTDQNTNNENPHQLVCRATFIEIIIRTAKYIYCDIVDEKDLKPEKNDYELVAPSKALGFFIDMKLNNYFLEQGVYRSVFREEKLYDEEVDMIFSMNQAAVQ